MSAKKKSDSKSDPALHRELLHSMLLQRRFEERASEAYALGKIGGFCHLYIGQEAVSAGTQSVLRPDDYIITTYRDHGQALARGISPRAIMAELFGRVDGLVGGKGGSMHMFDRAVNFLGGHGIVGGHIPIATGVGFAIKYRGGDQVCICFMGEAAVNGGAFHESLNMAGLWKLPVIYVIENNKYGMGTDIARASSIKDLSSRAASYAMAGYSVDGQDVLAVRDAMSKVIDAARSEQAPALVEIHTSRFVGHSMSDATSGTYRSKAELDAAEARDPIALFRAVMTEAGALTDAEYEKLDNDMKAVAQDAWDFADASPEPPLEALYEHVLAESPAEATVEA